MTAPTPSRRSTISDSSVYSWPDYAVDVLAPPDSLFSAVTFGVEWEFLADTAIGPYGDLRLPQTHEPEPQWREQYSDGRYSGSSHPALRHIAVFLRQNGFKAICSMELNQVAKDNDFAQRFPDISREAPRRIRCNEYFVVKSDSTLQDEKAHMVGRVPWVGVEICTPVYKFDRPESIRDLQKAFQLVNDAFRTKTNDTCGLHVHVGNGDSGFELEWVRNIAGLCWAASPLLDFLHPHRRGPGHEYAAGLRYFAGLAHDQATLELKGSLAPELRPRWRPRYGGESRARDPLRILDLESDLETWVQDPWMGWCGVQRLLGAKSLEELAGMVRSVRPGMRLAYNFNSLGSSQGNVHARAYRTIEFRQHEGTRWPLEVSHWASVCCRIVRFALGDYRNDVSAVARRAVDGSLFLGTYGPIEFLRDIGANEAADYYAANIDLGAELRRRLVEIEDEDEGESQGQGQAKKKEKKDKEADGKAKKLWGQIKEKVRRAE